MKTQTSLTKVWCVPYPSPVQRATRVSGNPMTSRLCEQVDEISCTTPTLHRNQNQLQRHESGITHLNIQHPSKSKYRARLLMAQPSTRLLNSAVSPHNPTPSAGFSGKVDNGKNAVLSILKVTLETSPNASCLDALEFPAGNGLAEGSVQRCPGSDPNDASPTRSR